MAISHFPIQTLPATASNVVNVPSGSVTATNVQDAIDQLAAETVREVLQANRTYYVRTDGNDSNTGMADTVGGAFLTVTHAINVIQALDLNQHTLTLHIGTGTWFGGPYQIDNILGNDDGDDGLIIEGNGSANTSIQLQFDSFINAIVRAIKLDAGTGDSFASLWVGEHSEVFIGDDVIFNSAGTITADIYTYDYGAVSALTSSYSVRGVGTRSAHLRIEGNARVNLSLQATSITISDAPTFTSAFITVQDHASATLGNSFTSSGSATGRKFRVTGSNCTLRGAVANLPGSLDGTYVADAICAGEIRGNVTQAPRTVTANTDTLGDTDYSIIANFAGTVTLTLPTASSFTNRILKIKTITANTVVSATSNVVPLIGGGAGTAILSGTAGRHAELQSDGTNWVIMGGVT